MRALRQPAVEAAEAHRPTVVLDAALLGEQRDHRERCARIDLRGVRFRHPGHVARELADHHLQPQAYAEEGDALLARVLRRGDLALQPTVPEARADEDAVDIADRVLGRPRVEFLRVHPVELRARAVEDGGVDQRLADREVGVVQLHVLADHGDAHFRVRLPQPLDEVPPVLQVSDRFGLDADALQDQIGQPARLEDERNLVDRVGGLERDHRLALDVAEEADLLAQRFRRRLIGPRDDHVRLDAERAQLAYGVLRRLGLQLARRADVGQQRDVDRGRRVHAERVPHLADRLDERLALDVTDRAADLDEHDLGVERAPRLADAAPDLVRDVRDLLDGAAEEVALPLLADHLLVNLAGGGGVGLREVLVEEALVVPEVQVRLGAVVGDEDLAVLVGRHRAGVDVDVGIEFEDGDAQPSGAQDPAERGGHDPFADGTHDAARDEDVLRHQPSDGRGGHGSYSARAAEVSTLGGIAPLNVSVARSRCGRGRDLRRWFSRIPRVVLNLVQSGCPGETPEGHIPTSLELGIKLEPHHALGHIRESGFRQEQTISEWSFGLDDRDSWVCQPLPVRVDLSIKDVLDPPFEKVKPRNGSRNHGTQLCRERGRYFEVMLPPAGWLFTREITCHVVPPTPAPKPTARLEWVGGPRCTPSRTGSPHGLARASTPRRGATTR